MEDALIRGLNHSILCTSTAQKAVDFFVGVMGQRFIKQTLCYDGKIPIDQRHSHRAGGGSLR